MSFGNIYTLICEYYFKIMLICNYIFIIFLNLFVIRNFRGTCSSVEMLKGTWPE